MTYYSKAGAKRAALKHTNPVLVRLANGRFDWFPAGHPIGYYNGGLFVYARGAKVIEVFSFGKWRVMK